MAKLAECPLTLSPRSSCGASRCVAAVASMAELNPGFGVVRSEDGAHLVLSLGATAMIGGGELGEITVAADAEAQVERRETKGRRG